MSKHTRMPNATRCPLANHTTGRTQTAVPSPASSFSTDQVSLNAVSVTALPSPPSSYTSERSAPSATLIWVSRISGFLLPFNLYVLPWMNQTPRTTDMLALVYAVFVLGTVAITRKVYWQPTYRAYGMFVLLLPMLWHGVQAGGLTPMVLPIRYTVAIFAALGLWYLVGQNETRRVFFKGVIVGCVCCAIVPVLQFMGFLSLTKTLGLAANDVVAAKFFGNRVWRVPGMEKHVNGSAVIIGLGVPCALGLLDEKRSGMLWLGLALAALFTGSAVTLNRASVIVSMLLLAAWFLLARRSSISTPRKVIVVMVVVALIVYVGPPGGWERWHRLQNLADYKGFQVRVATFIAALDLLWHNPMGVGKAYETLLLTYTKNTATHNAILQMGLLAGLPFALYMTGKLLLLSVSILVRGGFVEGWISGYLLGIFFFEEYLAIPTLVTIVVWLMIVPIERLWRVKSDREIRTGKTPLKQAA